MVRIDQGTNRNSTNKPTTQSTLSGYFMNAPYFSHKRKQLNNYRYTIKLHHRRCFVHLLSKKANRRQTKLTTKYEQNQTQPCIVYKQSHVTHHSPAPAR